jgi:hypothetical protein
MNVEAAAPSDIDAQVRRDRVIAAPGRKRALVQGHDGIDAVGQAVARRFP